MAQRTMQRRGGRDRRANDPSVPTRLTPAVIESITSLEEQSVRLEFDTRVQLARTPGFRAGADGAETVASVEAISATALEITFTGNVAGSKLRIGEGDPGVRTPSGGFVPAGNYNIPPVI